MLLNVRFVLNTDNRKRNDSLAFNQSIGRVRWPANDAMTENQRDWLRQHGPCN